MVATLRKRDSVFDVLLQQVPNARDRLPIPAGPVIEALDRIETAIVNSVMRELRRATEDLLRRAQPYLEQRDTRGIQTIQWNLPPEIAPAFQRGAVRGMNLGGDHAKEEMIAIIPSSFIQASQFQRNTKTDVQDLLRLNTRDIINTQEGPVARAIRAHSFQLSGDFSDAALNGVTDRLGRHRRGLRDVLQQSIIPDPATGDVMSRRELRRQIQRVLKVNESRATNIARTETTRFYNEGRRATMDATPLVEAYRFLAINDDRTTQICIDRNGAIIPKGDPSISENQPPLHYQCRSVLSPVMPRVNRTHRGWVNDPARRLENRSLSPLAPGWNAGSILPPGPPPVIPPEPVTPPARDLPQAPPPPPKQEDNRLRQPTKTQLPRTGQEQQIVELAYQEYGDEMQGIREALEQFDEGGEVRHLYLQLLRVQTDPNSTQDQLVIAQRAFFRARADASKNLAQRMTDFRASLNSRGISLQQAGELREQFLTIDPSATSTLSNWGEAQLKFSIDSYGSMTTASHVRANQFDTFVFTNDRAHFSPALAHINVGDGTGSPVATIWHELAHTAEIGDDLTYRGSVGFRNRRIREFNGFTQNRGRVPTERMAVLTGNPAYEDDEVAGQDTFITSYIGKFYDGGDFGATDALAPTEVMSVGVEQFARSSTMSELALTDFEHFELTVGQIARQQILGRQALE